LHSEAIQESQCIEMELSSKLKVPMSNLKFEWILFRLSLSCEPNSTALKYMVLMMACTVAMTTCDCVSKTSDSSVGSEMEKR